MNKKKIIRGKCLIEGFETEGVKIESLRLSVTGALNQNLYEATHN